MEGWVVFFFVEGIQHEDGVKKVVFFGGRQYVQIPGVPRPVMTCHAHPIFSNQDQMASSQISH